MEKIVGVTSYTGKVGKSTICNNLLYPRMPGAKVIRLETVNLSGHSGAEDEKQLKGRDLIKLQDELIKTKSAIVDVGASNIESFILALNQQGDAHLDFDYFLVPIEANAGKQNEIKEAFKTIESLALMGIEPERIKVVFNKLLVDNTIEDEMQIVFNYHKKNRNFTLNRDAVIHESPAFHSLDSVKKSYIELLADNTNYREAIKNIPLENEKERTAVVKLMRAQGYVKAIDREFNEVFGALFGE
jgi:hypothetical protein